MDALYVAIIVAVLMIAAAVAFMAWTGGYEGLNPINIDNLNSVLRPGVENP